MHVALGDVGGPALPLGEEAGQVVDGPDELVADEQLGAPGGGRRPGSRAGSPAFRGGCRPSTGWAGRRSGGPRGPGPCRRRRSRRPGTLACGSRVNPRVNTEEPASQKAFVNEPWPMPQLTRVKPDHGHEQPGDQQDDQGHRLADGQDPVLGGVGAGQAGHPAEDGPDDQDGVDPRS